MAVRRYEVRRERQHKLDLINELKRALLEIYNITDYEIIGREGILFKCNYSELQFLKNLIERNETRENLVKMFCLKRIENVALQEAYERKDEVVLYRDVFKAIEDFLKYKLLIPENFINYIDKTLFYRGLKNNGYMIFFEGYYIITNKPLNCNFSNNSNNEDDDFNINDFDF